MIRETLTEIDNAEAERRERAWRYEKLTNAVADCRRTIAQLEARQARKADLALLEQMFALSAQVPNDLTSRGGRFLPAGFVLRDLLTTILGGAVADMAMKLNATETALTTARAKLVEVETADTATVADRRVGASGLISSANLTTTEGNSAHRTCQWLGATGSRSVRNSEAASLTSGLAQVYQQQVHLSGYEHEPAMSRVTCGLARSGGVFQLVTTRFWESGDPRVSRWSGVTTRSAARPHHEFIDERPTPAQVDRRRWRAFRMRDSCRMSVSLVFRPFEATDVLLESFTG
jgi:hypothetical protein